MAVEEQITWGDLIGAAISAIGLIGLASSKGRQWWLRNHPFRLLFYATREQRAADDYKRKLCVPVGQVSECFIRIVLRIDRKIERLDLRFVQWRWFQMDRWKPRFCFYEDAPRVITRSFNEEPWCESRQGVFKFLQPIHLPKGDSLWLNITVGELAEWDGYISLQLTRGDDCRGYGRARVTIGKPPT